MTITAHLRHRAAAIALAAAISTVAAAESADDERERMESRAVELLLRSQEERLAMALARDRIALSADRLGEQDALIRSIQTLEAECRSLRTLADAKKSADAEKFADDKKRAADAPNAGRYEAFHQTCENNLEKARAEKTRIRESLSDAGPSLAELTREIADSRARLERIDADLAEIEKAIATRP